MKTTKRFHYLFLVILSFSTFFAAKGQKSFVAIHDTATTVINTPIIIHPRLNDTYPFTYQTIRFYILGTTIGNPTSGTFQFIGDDILYTPNQGFTGYDSFLYAISLDGSTILDSSSVSVNVVADSDPSFHANVVGITPESCMGGTLKIGIKNGTAPYLYQINGSSVSTTNTDSIIVNNLISSTSGTIHISDANNNTINTTFTIPENQRILCLDGPLSGYTPVMQCQGSTTLNVWGGTPPFSITAFDIQNPQVQPIFVWENGTSDSRHAYTSNLCQGMYSLSIIDANNIQAQGGFIIDSIPVPVIYGQLDTCVSISNYIAAYVSDVYTDNNGTTAVWQIIPTLGDTITLNVHYSIQTSGQYQFVLYLNCGGNKSVTVLTSIYFVDPDQLVLSVSDLSMYTKVRTFPNPVTDVVYVDFQAKQRSSMTVSIFDILGKKVYQGTEIVKQGINSYLFDFNQFTKGTYFIQFVDEQRNNINVKVVK